MAIPQVQPAVQSLKFAKRRMEYGIEVVPDEKLSWSPGGSAPSALAVAGKIERFAHFITHLINHRAMPEGAPPAYEPPADRAAALASLDRGFNKLSDALESLTESDLALTAPAPWGTPIPLAGWVHFATAVPAYFQGQLNLIQLCYGDENPNIPPELMPNR
jgi:hypothetical protein